MLRDSGRPPGWNTTCINRGGGDHLAVAKRNQFAWAAIFGLV